MADFNSNVGKVACPLFVVPGKRLSILQKYNMRKDDLIRLFHMMDAAQEALSFIEGKTRNDLNTNRYKLCHVPPAFDVT